MKKALVLHAWEETSKGCWYPWLKGELESRGYEVFVPDLPNTEYPVFQEQFDFIENFASNMQEWDLVVGHSLWCTLATQVIERLKLQWINCVLVASVYPLLWTEIKEMLWKYYETLAKYYGLPNTFEKLDTSYSICLSDNDPFITMESAKKYYSNFTKESWNTVEFKEFHDMYHFSDGAPEPVKQIPEMLEYIK